MSRHRTPDARYKTPDARHKTPDAAELPDAPRGGPISQHNPADVDDLTSVDVQRALETNNAGLLHDWVVRLMAERDAREDGGALAAALDLIDRLETEAGDSGDSAVTAIAAIKRERDTAERRLANVEDALLLDDPRAAVHAVRVALEGT